LLDFFQNRVHEIEAIDDGNLQPEVRDDQYFSPARTFGLKVRGGVKIELKYLQGEGAWARNSSPISGVVQRWSKWELPLAVPAPREVHESELWVRVNKTRWTMKYHVVDDSQILTVGINTRVDEGCNVELVKILYGSDDKGDSAVWSLGFESFGTRDLVQRNLDLAADSFLAADPPLPDLPQSNSLSYPDWLQQLRRDDGQMEVEQ